MYQEKICHEVTIAYDGKNDKPFYEWGFSVDNVKEILGVAMNETSIKIVPMEG
tara:strand:- start:109 stop:267 length:159 start_codon:yes stop_codon:yes gene_type:complete